MDESEETPYEKTIFKYNACFVCAVVGTADDISCGNGYTQYIGGKSLGYAGCTAYHGKTGNNVTIS